MSSIDISIIMPTYNSEKYIEETISYIQAQTLSNWELICVDDGSTDGTVNIINQIATKDSRIQVLTQDHLGAGSARNAGLKLAKGVALSFLDSDDIFEKDMLEKSYSLLLSTDSDVVIFRSDQLDANNNEVTSADWALKLDLIGGQKSFSPTEICRNIFQFCNGWPWDKLFRADFINAHKLKFQNTHFFNDSLFVYSALMHSTKISLLLEILARKRINAGVNQISLNRSKYWVDFEDVIIALYNMVNSEPDNSIYLESLQNYSIHLASVMLETTTKETNILLKHYIKTNYSKTIDFDNISPNIIKNSKEYRKIKDIIAERSEEKKTICCKNVIQTIYYNPDYIQKEDNYTDYIPILLAADNNYARQMYITLSSILDCKKDCTKYIVYMLIPSKFSDRYVKDFEDLASRYEYCQLRFVIMGKIFSDIETTIAHITSPTYYRLVAGNIIPYSKCIYLDVDLIVCCDLTSLYEVNLGNNILGGVKAPVYICSVDHGKEHCELTGLETIDQYVNAGVLLLNLIAMRDRDISEKLVKLAYNRYPSQDQDVFNIVAYNRIIHLDCKYNVMTKYDLEDFKRVNQIITVYGLKKAIDGYRNPHIIHYADKNKPWKTAHCLYSERWWAYCSKSPYYEEMWKDLRYGKNETTENSDLLSTLIKDVKWKGLKYYMYLIVNELRR